MTSSLRDALRQSGVLDQFKPVERRDARPAKKGGGAARRGGKAAPRGKADAGRERLPRTGEDMDLAKAYALRAQTEQRERDRKLHAEREAAERRRRQREQVTALIDGHTLNRDDADVVRNFEYGGKIRRVYVSDEQLDQLNTGRLGVVQMRGRYLLVTRALAEQVRAVDDTAVALLVDPDTADSQDSHGHAD